MEQEVFGKRSYHEYTEKSEETENHGIQKMYARVSKRGQVTIPKAIRERLGIADEGAVLFLVEDDEVKLKAVPGARAGQLGGSLRKYAKQYVPLNKVRN